MISDHDKKILAELDEMFADLEAKEAQLAALREIKKMAQGD